MKNSSIIDDYVSVSARSLPLVRKVDVLVTGGSVAAVAAACAAAAAGAEVLLAAPRLFLGEELCGSLDLRKPDCKTNGVLTEAIFGSCQYTTPLTVKHVLSQALWRAGVEVVFAVLPVGCLRDEQGRLAGAVLADRAGRQAVTAGFVIDATLQALLAQSAGLALFDWSNGEIVVARTVLGGEASLLPPLNSVSVKLPGLDQPESYHHYRLQVPLPSMTPSAWAEMEEKVRDQTFRPHQLRAAELVHSDVPLKLTSAEYFKYLSCSTPESDAAEIGRVAAAAACARPPLHGLNAATETGATENTVDLNELLTGFRPALPAAEFIAAGSDRLRILDQAEVLVVGGGTAGAAAAIAAARKGRGTIMIEFQEGPGGIGTVGMIGKRYHGRNAGFAAQVPFPGAEVNLDDKMEWLRQEFRRAGGRLWRCSLAWGVLRRGESVCGAAVATPWGHGAISAQAVIDATGNADLAAAAEAATDSACSAADIASQGTGLGMRPLSCNMRNSDCLLVDDSDVVDVSTAMLGRTLAEEPGTFYDIVSMPQTRERRRLQGEHVLRYLDQLLSRTYPDTIVFSDSDYDSHGYPSLDFFALLPHTEETKRMNHPAPAAPADTPYRALLPCGLDGLLVIGLGASMERDASAMMRMQLDLLNQGYAAGLAAAAAVATGCRLREVDIEKLQRELVSAGALPERVLTDQPSPRPDAEELRQAVCTLTDNQQDYLSRSKALGLFFAAAEDRVPVLQDAFRRQPDNVQLAALLGFMGGREGGGLLIKELDAVNFDDKIFQGSMAEYAHLPTPVDGLIMALGRSGDPAALEPILRKARQLDAETTLSHHRAVALALAELGDPRAAQVLAAVLEKPGMQGHAMLAVEPLADRDVLRRRREPALREIILARALYRCGDAGDTARRILLEYGKDLRAIFAAYARQVIGEE